MHYKKIFSFFVIFGLLTFVHIDLAQAEKVQKASRAIQFGARQAVKPFEVEKTSKPKKVAAPAAAPKKAFSSRLGKYEWGVYKGAQDMAWEPYVNAKGEEKQLLGKIARAPKAKWFGAWIPVKDIERKTQEYIINAQHGNKDTLVQMTIFRMDPWYQESKTRQPSTQEVKLYKTWIRKQVKAIGSARVLIVLQPDLTFLRTVPNFELSSSLIKFAAKQYSTLPRAYVYLEAGAADWPAPGQGGAAEAVRLLSASGIEYVDGIATNTTHYSATVQDILRIKDIIDLLHAKGFKKNYKGVINTSSNGQPFEFGKYEGPDPDDAWVCESKNDPRTCVALGIPPTAKVALKKWHLGAEINAIARKYIDAYLWIGRPWLKRQNSPFLKDKALTLVRNWEFL